MLNLKRLSLRKDEMEDILNWNIQAQFIKVKNNEEKKEGKQFWIYPKMHYLLQLVESQKIPFEFNLREKIIDVDLLLFVYTVVYTKGQHFPYWFPRSSVYLEYKPSSILKRIKLDNQFADKVSNELFEITPEDLIKQLKIARGIFNEFRDRNIRVNPFDDFE